MSISRSIRVFVRLGLVALASACSHESAKIGPGNDASVGEDAVAFTAEAAPDRASEPIGAPDAAVSFDLAVRDGRSDGRALADAAVAPDAGIRDGRSDAGSSTDGPSATEAGPSSYSGLPQPMCVWNQAYQQDYAPDTVAEILAGARGCYVLVDPFSDDDARSAIPTMKQAGNTVSCYISVGTCEDWRDDFSAMKPYCVSKQWGEWPGEYFVNRTAAELIALIEARVDKMATWGCNLVEFDNMDWAFDESNRSQYGITATAADAETYNETLCAYVHAHGMGCMAKSSAQGATDFDGLTVESSPDDMDWWEPSHMKGMLAAGKIGIVVHYDETDCAGVLAHYQSEYGSKLSFICEDRGLKKYRHFP